jgi:amphi-Trp domain-containing protein
MILHRERHSALPEQCRFLTSSPQEASIMASQHLKVRTKAGLVEIINHIEHLVRSLKEGQLCIRKNGEAITLKPQGPVMLGLEAETRLEKDSLREKLIIELKWKMGTQDLPEGDAFTITHLEPTPAP